MSKNPRTGVLSWATSINAWTKWSVNSKVKSKPTTAVSIVFQLLMPFQSNIVDGKLNDHDEAIRKLQSDIKLLKMSRPKSEAKDGADPGMSGDQLGEIFDTINQLGDDLRKEMDEKYATKKALKDHITGCDVEFGDIKKRLDALEKDSSRLGTRLAEIHQNDIKDKEDLRERINKNKKDIAALKDHLGRDTPKVPQATGNRDEDLQNLANLMADMQDALARKEDKTDAQQKYDDLCDRIKNLKPAGPAGPAITDDDIKKWNGNLDRTKVLEDELAKLKKEMAGINADQLRADINNLNTKIQNFVTIDDFKKTQSDIAKLKLQIEDLKYALKTLTQRVDDLEKKLAALEA